MRLALPEEISKTNKTDAAARSRQNTTHLPPATFIFPCNILEPLSPEMHTLLGLAPGSNPPNVTKILLERVTAGKKIWELGGRAIFDLGEGVVVKVGNDLDRDEASAMLFLEERFPTFPAPHCLGLVVIGRRSLLFMTKIPGDTRIPVAHPFHAVKSGYTAVLKQSHLGPAGCRKDRGATPRIFIGQVQGY